MTYSRHEPLALGQKDEVSAMPDEEYDAWLSRRRADVVIDPEWLADAKYRLAAEAERRTELAKRTDRHRVWATWWLLASAAGLITSAVQGFATGSIVGGIAFALGVAAAIASVWAKSRSRSSLRPTPGRDELVRIAELDGPCRTLLARAQQAIGEVLSSTVHRENLLDQAVGEATLRRHEWKVASDLREISGVRAASDANPPVGPQSARIREPQQRALAFAQGQTEARVREIEQYAARVKRADAAYLDRQVARRASELNPRVLDLLARTMANDHGTDELGELAEQAAAAERAFQDSIDQAHEAGAPLALPPEVAQSDATKPPDRPADPS